MTLKFSASSPRADEYRVEYKLHYNGWLHWRGVTVPDTNKDTYTVTQGQLSPGRVYELHIVPYLAGRRGHSSRALIIATEGTRHRSS